MALGPGAPPLLRVRGPVDAWAADRFRAEPADLSRGGTGPLTVDLTAVGHLASVGVAALAGLQRARDGSAQQVVPVAPTGTPAVLVLDLVGPLRQATP